MLGQLLLLCCGLWGADPDSSAAERERGGAVSEATAEVAEEIKALEHAEFRVREAAGKRLLARGEQVVVPLTALANNGSPEASVRAFELLRLLYRDGTDATYETVEAAYEGLVRSENVQVAARAEAAMEAAVEIRHRRALASFRKLGGVVKFHSEESPEADAPTPPVKFAMISRKWSGADEGLKYLRRIEDFRAPAGFQRTPPLYVIEGAKVTEAGLAALQLTLPNLQVTTRGPACFGVQASPGENGCRISGVERGSAADRAGLQEGDLILKFNDVPINDFDGLIAQIKQKEPGNKVPVAYLRGDNEATVIVELDEWK